jgi:hypothetical protein
MVAIQGFFVFQAKKTVRPGLPKQESSRQRTSAMNKIGKKKQKVSSIHARVYLK